jgi:hypothetical protein
VSLAHGQMADVLSTFRRSAVTGQRRNRPMVDDVVRGLFGEETTPEASTLAGAIGEVFETLRQRFNAAGGAIAKLDTWGLPQAHDAAAMLSAGREKWKAFVLPLLDREKMRDPLTGGTMTQERLVASLDHVFDSITTDGWANHKPTLQTKGAGALASQRADHRFLAFKDAESWLNYDREFGNGDPIAAVFQHVNGMARDVAAMEILGPNPGAMVEWLKQVVTSEAGKAIAGKASLYDMNGKAAEKIADKLKYLGWRIDSVYQYVRGRQVVSSSVAAGFGDVRNVLTSAQLGSASILAAATDPFIDAATRYLSGLPIAKAFTALLHTGRDFTREQAVRSGILLDDFLHIMHDEARWAGTLGGREWSRWLADRTLTWSGLQPITQARKHVFAREFEAALADHAGREFGELPPPLRRTMEGYGIDRTDWDVMRSAELHHPRAGSAGFLRPVDVAALADGPALPKVQQLLKIDATDEAAALVHARAGARRTAEKYVEMILGQTERAVPEGTARAKSYVTGAATKGTVFGELMQSFLQYKVFSLSFTTLQMQALMHELGESRPRGAAYASSLALGLTLGGALALQLKNLANGKDPQSMEDPKFWLHALQTGGGFGLMGDFLFADVNRFGQSLGETIAGPTVGAASDALRVTAGNVQKVATGKAKDINLGRDAVGIVGRYTPVLSSYWPLRAAYRRVFLDQVQYLVDPEASRQFSEQQGRMRRETGQEFFWTPGEALPRRGPDLGRALH